MLKGKKTYLVALGAGLLAIGGWLHGDLTMTQAIEAFIAGGGLASLRAALADMHADVKDVKRDVQ